MDNNNANISYSVCLLDPYQDSTATLTSKSLE